jgi:phosphotriesterase-related protein
VIETVLGPVEQLPVGVIDAHAHIWIDGVEGIDSTASFVLSDETAIAAELRSFRAVGGVAAVDCMPAGAGRNIGLLARISAASDVAIVACTGFHLRQYFAIGHPLNPWERPPATNQTRFEAELKTGVGITGLERPVRAGAIKTAHPGHLDDPVFLSLFHAALAASRSTGAAVIVHTEQGAGVEDLVELIERADVAPQRVVLCHMDKRPDVGLHRALARAGYLLEYDTFLRRKYDPEHGVWPLLEQMLSQGLEDSIACALDLADPDMWVFRGAPAGMAALASDVTRRLEQIGAHREAIDKLIGRNIADRLQPPTPRQRSPATESIV